jgi:ParB-like chromosome segregation protein Spo0J
VIGGHGRLSACRELGWAEVPTIELGHLTDLQARADMVADTGLAEKATWDDRLLVAELRCLALAQLDFTIAITGLEPGVCLPASRPR